MSKREVVKETGDVRSETSPSAEFLEAEGMSMGKEVKIGLGVILALLVAFGGVLYYRLSRPPANDTAKAETEAKDPVGAVADAGAPAGTTAAATVVAATGGSEPHRQRPSVSDMAQWSAAPVGNSAAKSREEPSIPSTPPSYMPRRDPFRRAARPVTNESAQTPAGADTSAAGTAHADPAVPATPTEQQQTNTVEVYSSPPNPLRDMSVGAPTDTGTYGAAASSSTVEIAAVPPTAPSPIAVQPAPSPVAAQPAPAYGANVRPAIRSLTDAPAAASRYGTSSLGTAAGDRSQTYGTGSSYAPGSSQAAPQATASPGKYVIQPNDNYWTISDRLYGSGAYFQALAEVNRKKFPDEHRLRAGEEIAVPGVAELEKSYPSLCPRPEHRDATKRHLSVVSSPARLGGRVYVVQEGDTLFDIARFELGKAARWAEIYQLNREAIGSDFDHLTPGLQLALPQDRPSGKVTQRGDDLYQR